LNAIGWFACLLDDYPKALECCREAVELHRKLDDAHGVAAAQDSLGYAYHHLHDYARAIACFGEAVRLWHQLGDRFNEADTFGRLGDSHLSAGDESAAAVAWQQGHAILESLRHPAAENMKAKINGLSAGQICA
jgi:tetratricopeptide (TPR) repeat protein